MKNVTIYTDGACSGNPGPGGWGAILQYGTAKKELSGSEPSTTNNRMELLGVISALELLKEPCSVDLYSDSKYVVDGITKGWAKGWRARGWVKSDKKPAKNPKRPVKRRKNRATPRRKAGAVGKNSVNWRRAPEKLRSLV